MLCKEQLGGQQMGSQLFDKSNKSQTILFEYA